MKLWLHLLIAGLMAATASARDFTSADGSKTISADFVRYNPRTGDVTLQMRDGRNVLSKADLFSEEDRAFFLEQYRKEELKGSIEVRAHDSLSRDAFKKDGLVVSFTDAEWEFTIKNESEIALENLRVKYWVVTERYNKGDERNETSSGEGNIAKLDPDAEVEIKGPSIRLITGAAPNRVARNEREAINLANRAAEYGRDRSLGWRCEVYNSDGELLAVESTGIRVDRILGFDDDKDDD
ncbi:MAG: hypothetical protein R3242_11235 [Akkermansiaceae bacterium]|nr:hypothetical protein [Akkermansiaceae bacterium]